MSDGHKTTEKPDKAHRAWEIDLLRGIAVLMMASFHAVFDLTVYFGANIDYLTGLWFYIGRLSAILFMFVSGISSVFSQRSIRRGAVVLGCGMFITAFSIPLMGENYIRFGILHFFGTVMILKGVFDYFVKSRHIRNAANALMIPVSILLGQTLPGIKTDTSLFLPLGIMPAGFVSYDYYPIFPWLAVFCAGALTGSFVYKNKRSIFSYNPLEEGNMLFIALCLTGRHSLAIYLLHQPVIMGLLYIIFKAASIFS